MGPVREATELASDYRFRYARYCLRWLIGLGLLLLLLLLWAPSVRASPVPFFVMFFYFGLPIGAGISFLALLGFTADGLWSRAAESSLQSARRLEQVKVTALAIILLPVCAMAIYFCLDGILNLEVHAFSKNTKHVVAWRVQPAWYVINVLLWGALGLGGIVQVARKLRSAYAA